MSDDDQAWTCATCGERYVIPSLARECENKHREGK